MYLTRILVLHNHTKEDRVDSSSDASHCGFNQFVIDIKFEFLMIIRHALTNKENFEVSKFVKQFDLGSYDNIILAYCWVWLTKMSPSLTISPGTPLIFPTSFLSCRRVPSLQRTHESLSVPPGAELRSAFWVPRPTPHIPTKFIKYAD